MAGRPRKPILVAAIDGDTRKRGANKHAEHVSGTLMAQRGIPDMPDFTAPRCPASAPPEVAVRYKAAQERMKVARRHWEYLAGELSREGMMSTLDEGSLTQAATVYAMAWEAFQAGDFRAHAEYSKTYMQIADRMGLNESARAKFPAKKPAMDDLESALCG